MYIISINRYKSSYLLNINLHRHPSHKNKIFFFPFLASTRLNSPCLALPCFASSHSTLSKREEKEKKTKQSSRYPTLNSCVKRQRWYIHIALRINAGKGGFMNLFVLQSDDVFVDFIKFLWLLFQALPFIPSCLHCWDSPFTCQLLGESESHETWTHIHQI